MTKKFGRQYRITIDPKDGLPPIVVTLPFTINFTVQRNVYADVNHFNIEIFNLSKANRRRIYQDRWDLRQPLINGVGAGAREITFEAGYGTLYQIFKGNIFQASSAREGVDIVTRIECLSGIYDVAASQTFTTIESGQTLKQVLEYLINDMPNLSLGAVGNYDQVFNRPVALSGSTWNLIKQYTGNNAFIDNDKIYCLKDAEAVGGEIYEINNTTGVLETPRRMEGLITVTTLFEPRPNIGSLLNFSSSVESVYDGQYKIIGLIHSGTISAAVCGTLRTIFSLNHPTFYDYTVVI